MLLHLDSSTCMLFHRPKHTQTHFNTSWIVCKVSLPYTGSMNFHRAHEKYFAVCPTILSISLMYTIHNLNDRQTSCRVPSIIEHWTVFHIKKGESVRWKIFYFCNESTNKRATALLATAWDGNWKTIFLLFPFFLLFHLLWNFDQPRTRCNKYINTMLRIASSLIIFNEFYSWLKMFNSSIVSDMISYGLNFIYNTHVEL